MGEINHLSKYATQQTNTANKQETILEYSPEDGTVERIRNNVNKGRESGVPVYMDLNDSAGNPLPDDTEVIMRVDIPTRDEPVTASEKLKNISGWNALGMGEQRNEENIDQTKIELAGQRVNVRYVDTLRFEILSSAAIDWSNSELYVDGKATETIPYNG